MDSKVLFHFLLGLLLLGFFNSVATEPAQCSQWHKVFPNCSCISALDENGQELPAVAVVDCSSQSLNSVPQKKFDYHEILYEFRLKNNSLSTLPSNAFQGIKIRHLDLSGNSIGVIDDNAFQGTELDMRIIHIEGNSSGEPQTNALHKLRYLEEITMTNYQVEELTRSTFLPFSNLIKLTLDNWGLVVIDAHALLATNNQYALRSLTLLNQKLPSLPVDLLTEVETHNLDKLHISKTLIDAVTSRAFKNLKNIKEIILSDNKIKTVANEAFYNIGDTLEKLDLGNNVLGESGQTNDLENVEGLSHLSELILQQNQLISIPKLQNLGNGQLFSMDLKKNRITSLSASDLASFVQRLKGLDLSENQIATIEDQAFSGATSLQSLIIKNQGGSQSSPQQLIIPSSLSQAAGSLTHLDLSGQQIQPTSLWTVLEKLEKLQTLILHSVEVIRIPDFTFRKLTDLSEINLSYNAITQLNDKTFVGPRNLQKVSLKFISISKLPSCLFHNHLKNISLDLGQVQIKCDCSLKNIVEEMKQGSLIFHDSGIPDCEDGRPFKSLDLKSCDAIECENYYPTTSPPEPPTTDDTTANTPTIQIRVSQIGQTFIYITWTISNASGLENYWVRVSTSEIKDYDNISPGSPKLNITGLIDDTLHHICVYARITGLQETVSQCETQRTSPGDNVTPAALDDEDTIQIGIIVGCIVGALVFLVIIAAIVYLLIIRRRPDKATGRAGMTGPVQPRTFAKSELPSINGDSKSFVKGKKGGMSDSKPVGGDMQIVAISDGQTRPAGGGRVGRAHLLSPDGTYEPMNKMNGKNTDYEPMEKRPPKPYVSMQGNANSAYENDHGSLPPTPTNKQQFDQSRPPASHGYYNEAFANDKYEEVVL